VWQADDSLGERLRTVYVENLAGEAEKRIFFMDFVASSRIRCLTAREGKSFSWRIDDGQESKSKESQSIREKDGEVSITRRSAAR